MKAKFMEDSLLAKFNIYDHLGYVLVGAITILVILLNISFYQPVPLASYLSLESLFVWLIIAYFFGHCVQGISNVLIKIRPFMEKKTNFTDDEKIVLEKISTFFEIPSFNPNEIYLMAQFLAYAKDTTGQVKSFNAYYSLYRGWYTTFLANSLFMLAMNIFRWFDVYLFVYLIISFTLFLVFLQRSKRFYVYLRKKTFQNYLLLKKIGEI